MKRLTRAVLPVALFLAAMSAPLIVTYLLPVYHGGDVQGFVERSRVWSESPFSIYRNFPAENYPFVGVLFTDGLMALLRKASPTETGLPRTYQLTMALVDATNTALTAWLAVLLALPWPWAVAFVIYLLPSSWAGGAVWGQIDGVTQLFIFLSMGGLVSCLNSKPAPGNPPLRLFLMFGLGVLGIVLGLLTKQLFVFSLPALTIAYIFTLLSLSNRFGFKTSLRLIVLTFAIALIIPLVDLLLVIPNGYHSHLSYILLDGGSDHINVVSDNGFNFWTLWTSGSSTKQIFNVVPKSLGAALYALLFLVLTAKLALRLRPLLEVDFTAGSREYSCEGRPFRDAAPYLLFYLALLNLGFNVLLTGTHERYLYHCYPFLILALLALYRRSTYLWPLLLTSAFAASTYGCFVLSIIARHKLPQFLLWTADARLVAIVHFLLLLLLTVIWLIQGPRPRVYYSALRSSQSA